MKIEFIEELPRRRYRGALTCELLRFLESGKKYAKVDTRNYKTVQSALASILTTISRNNLPIKARMINGQLYLERKEDTNA